MTLPLHYQSAKSLAGLIRRRKIGARYTPRGSDPVAEADGLWVHPKDLHGLLLGVSRTGLAWEWCGRKDLVPPRPA